MRLQDMTSDPVELAFIQSIDGSQAARGDPRAREIPRDKARLLLEALSEAGMLQRHETTRARRGAPVRPSVSSMPVLGAPAAPPPTQRAARERPAVDDAADGRTQDYFWALDVGADAPAADIDRAYEALARSFHADRYRLSPEEDRKAARRSSTSWPRRTARCAIRRSARATSPS
jgi:hypothetical protein